MTFHDNDFSDSPYNINKLCNLFSEALSGVIVIIVFSDVCFQILKGDKLRASLDPPEPSLRDPCLAVLLQEPR